MLETLKAINIVENRLAGYKAHATASPYFDNAKQIEALEFVLQDLNEELEAEMRRLDAYAEQLNINELEVY